MDITMIYVWLTVFFAAMAQSITGFGFAVVGAPLLLLVMEPKQVVSLMLMGAFVLNCMVISQTRGQGDLKMVWLMFLASLFGILPGVYVLKVIDVSVLKLYIGIIIILVSISMFGNYAVPLKRPRLAILLVGIISGFMGGSTSMSGPPVALFLMNQQQDKQAFRANTVRYFCLCNITTLFIMYYAGTLDANILRHSPYLLSGVVLGVCFGERIFRRMAPQVFRQIAAAVVFLSGVMSVGGEIIKWIYPQ
ncbi:sulfite exporter taue/safe [Lucifera butyrica]|uniref:Probable membrane transporter protein n=1 Tax=Lucifera butyrica TaxID=1351585 RepID=A0A498RBH2_9FIRM|nr:sulfite exporter TauE/SafE family protein [Lucifera butyrica]VBB08247.1 sulfite exporter taue/safe [Lucifera butyrica]